MMDLLGVLIEIFDDDTKIREGLSWDKHFLGFKRKFHKDSSHES